MVWFLTWRLLPSVNVMYYPSTGYSALASEELALKKNLSLL